MKLRYRLWGVASAAFCAGVFAGLIIPPLCLVILEGVMLVFVAFCWMCS